MSYKKFLATVDWRRPLDRGRTPSENRAAIAKIDQLVEETGCTKTKAFCQIKLNFNTYYKIKREDGFAPTPHNLCAQVRASNNVGGPGKPKGYKSHGHCKHKTVLKQMRESLDLIEREAKTLRSFGVDITLAVGGVTC
jgi:hypothetical protein